jgi:hypothetical protein
MVTVASGLFLLVSACVGERKLQADAGGDAGTTGTAGGSGTAGTSGGAGTGGIEGTGDLAGTSGTAGTAGTAGVTGTGGSTTDGSAGNDAADAALPPFDAGAPACTQVFARPGSEWTFGFEPKPVSPGTFNAVVSSVTATQLVLQPASGDAVTFRWAGPSLATEFAVAENVSCEKTANNWFIVKGTNRTAEIHVETSNTGITTSGPFPEGGTYTLEPECATVSDGPCAGASPVVHTTYRVSATRNGDSVVIPPASTATLGPLQITNVFHDQGRGGGAGECHIDFTNIGLISVLSPR